MAEPLLQDKQLAERWGCSIKTVRRRRIEGKLPWIDLAGKDAKKPMPRFRLSDIISFEEKNRMDITIKLKEHNDKDIEADNGACDGAAVN